MSLSERLKKAEKRAKKLQGKKNLSGCKSCKDKMLKKMKKKDISVVIASRDEGKWLTDTITSIKKTGEVREIVVVDDGSKVEVADDRIDVLIRHNHPIGAGKSRDEGLKKAKGKVKVVCDAHMGFPSGVFTALYNKCISERCFATPSVSGFGEEKDKHACGADIGWERSNNKAGHNWQRESKNTGWYRRTGILGGCYSATSEIWDELGDYPSQADKWGDEEPLLAMWAYMHDVKIYSTSDYIVKHRWGKTETTWGGPSSLGKKRNIRWNLGGLFSKELCDLLGIPWRNQGVWRNNLKKTEAQMFWRLFHIPVDMNEEGHVTGFRKITVVVTTKDEQGSELQDTCASLINSMGTRHELIVVDDAGKTPVDEKKLKNAVKKRIKRKSWRDKLNIKVLRNKESIGCSQSRAKAIDNASGDIFILFDGHQRMDTQYGLEKLAELCIEKNCICCGSVRNLGVDINSSNRTLGASWKLKEHYGLLNGHDRIGDNKDKIIKKDTLIGGGYCISKELLDKMGGWVKLPGRWSQNEQWNSMMAYFLGIDLYAHGGVDTQHLWGRRKRLIPIPSMHTRWNAHCVFYTFFPETYESVWKDRLPYLDDLPPEAIRMREKFMKMDRVKDEYDWYRDFAPQLLEGKGGE